ncbi:MAG: ABC transporter substrate-binding protein [Candidatus Binatia bacterium]
MRSRIVAGLLLLTLLGCRSSSGSSGVALIPYLRLAGQDDVPTLDPARGYDTSSWQFEEMLFNTLVDYDARGRLIQELATDWEVSADQRAYTFHLRAGVRFTNGRPVSAADVRYSIERVLDPRTGSQGAEFFRNIAGADACASGPCRVTGIETPDAHTVRFHLRDFDPLFLHKLAMPFAAAVPSEEVARWGEDFARHPVGSGPFMLKEWVPGQHLLLVRNPHYFVAGVPRLAGVLRLVGVNDDLAWLKYASGQLDVSSIPPAEFPRVIRDPRYQPLLRHVTTMRTSYLGMNCRMAPFNDRRVRQAMNVAIDKHKLLRLINNRGVVAKGFLPPNMPGYNPRVPGYPFDPARARQLLAAAGYPNGFTTTLWVRSDATALRLAQAVQQDLAEVKVRCRIKAIAWGPFLQAVRTPDLVPFFSLGWEADFPDPSNFLEVLLHSKYIGSNNNTNYHNPVVDDLLDTAARTVDPQTRLQLLRRAELVAVADAPWVFLYHPVSYVIVHPRVRDFQLHPLRPARFERVWLAGTARQPHAVEGVTVPASPAAAPAGPAS